MVDPHAMSERTQNSCVGMPRRRATSLHGAAARRAFDQRFLRTALVCQRCTDALPAQ